jgi:hypothetical protein
MTVNIQQVNTAIETFQTWVTKTNLVINAIALACVTVGPTANGDLNTGNGFVNGIFGSNTFCATTIRPGNIHSTSGTLTITANTITVGNSTVNSFANSTYISTAKLEIGNSTVGFMANTSAIRLNGKNYTNLDSHIKFSNNAVLIGDRPHFNMKGSNSIILTMVDNVAQDRVDLVLDFTMPDDITAQTITLGNSTVNSFINATQATITSIVSVNAALTSQISVGNSTVNTFANSSQLTISRVVLGNSTVGFTANTTAILLNGKAYTNLDSHIVFANSGSSIGDRPTINFISTVTCTANMVDNVAQNRVDVTLNANTQPAGSTTQLQFNDGGVMAGAAGLLWTKASNTLTFSNTLVTGNSTVGFSANVGGTLRLNGKNYTNLDSAIIVSNTGTTVGTRPQINFIPGTSATVDVTDNSGNNRIDVQIGLNAVAVSAGVIGGSNTQVQFNDSSGFNGSSNFTYDKVTQILTVSNTIATTIMTTNTITTNTVIFAQSHEDDLTVTVSTASQTVLDSYFLTDFRAVEYLVYIKDNTANAYQLSKLLMIHNDGGASVTEYGTISTNTNIGVFAATVNTTHAILQYTSAGTANSVVKLHRTRMIP